MSMGGTAATPAAGMRLGGRYRLAGIVRETNGALEWAGTDEMLNRLVTIRTLASGRPVAAGVIAAVLAAARLNDTRLARIFDADCDAAPGTALLTAPATRRDTQCPGHAHMPRPAPASGAAH